MKCLVGILREDLPLSSDIPIVAVSKWVSSELVPVRWHLIVYFQFCWDNLASSIVHNLWEDGQALLDPVRTGAIQQELLQTHHSVLVDVHAGKHLLHVLRLHPGVNLRPHQVVDGICHLCKRLLFIIIIIIIIVLYFFHFLLLLLFFWFGHKFVKANN